MDCFVASLLAMTSKYDLAFPRRIAPRLCINDSPKEGVALPQAGSGRYPKRGAALPQEGSGECRVPVAPAAARVE